MNKIFKRFVVAVCLIACIFTFVPQRKAKAIALVDDGIAIAGGIVLAPEVAIALGVCALGYAGYKLTEDYVDDFKDYVKTTCIDTLKGYIFSAKDNDGNQYAAISDKGIDYMQSVARNAQVDGIPTRSVFNVSRPKLPLPLKSYSSGGYNFNSYKVLPHGSGYDVYSMYFVKAGVSVNLKFVTSKSGSKTVSYGPRTYDSYVRFSSFPNWDGFSISMHSLNCEKYPDFIYNNSTSESSSHWIELADEYVSYSSDMTIDTGISDVNKTVVNTGVVTGSGVEGNASDRVATGSNVAVPISGQYESSTGVQVYGVDGSVGELSGLTSSVSTDTDIDSDSGVSSSWLERIWNGIKSLADTVCSGFENVIDGNGNILSGIRSGVKSIVDSISDIFTISDTKVEFNIKPLEVAGDTFKTRFPFCIPFDLVKCINELNVGSQAPAWDIVFPSDKFGNEGHLVIDFAPLEKFAVIIRWGVLMLFGLFLLIITRRII